MGFISRFKAERKEKLRLEDIERKKIFMKTYPLIANHGASLSTLAYLYSKGNGRLILICPECTDSIDKTFCNRCGAKGREYRLIDFCKNCFHRCSYWDKFCPNCGEVYKFKPDLSFKSKRNQP